MSHVLPPFEELRDAGFVHSALKDELILEGNRFPSLPADILIAQANFVEGGCVLAMNFHHSCLDGIGAMVALKVWAESCRYVQGDTSATCGWFDPKSFNHNLPEILYNQEGYARPAHEVDSGVWGFLPFLTPVEPFENNGNGTLKTGKSTLPPPPVFPHRFVWPPPPAQDGLKTSMFLIAPENIQKLKQQVTADPEAEWVITSFSDIVQAFF